MAETLRQEFRGLCDDMRESPDTFFHDNVVRNRRFMNTSVITSGGLSLSTCRIRVDDVNVWGEYTGRRSTYIESSNDFLRIHVACFQAHFQAAMDYCDFDNEGGGSAKKLIVWDTDGTSQRGVIPIDFNTDTQELTLEGKKDSKYKNISAVFTPIKPESTHGSTTITCMPKEGVPKTVEVFKELPVRKVTIQLLHGWMQRTFPEIFKPVKIDAVADFKRLKLKIAQLIGWGVVPTDEMLEYIRTKESPGWELIAVKDYDDRSAGEYHQILIQNRGAENVFHHQMSAKRYSEMIRVNLYFVKKGV